MLGNEYYSGASLLQEIDFGDYDEVTWLLSQNRYSDSVLNRALCLAADYGHTDIVFALLEIPKVKNNAHDAENEALRCAASGGHLDIVNMLLEIPEVAQNAAALDNEALRYATKNGHTAVVEKLLTIPQVRDNAHVCPYIRSEFGDNCALLIAATNGYTDIVNALLTIDAVKNVADADDNCALRWATSRGNTQIVEALLTIPAIANNLAAQDNEAIRSAAYYHHVPILLTLLYEAFRQASHHAAPIETVNQLLALPGVETALFDTSGINKLEILLAIFAAKSGDIASIKVLLQNPQISNDIALFDNEALRSAAKGGHTEIVNLLLTLPAVRDNAAILNNEALNFAIKNGHTAIIEALLKIPAVQEKVSMNNNALLNQALDSGNYVIAEQLLKNSMVMEKAIHDTALLTKLIGKNPNIKSVQNIIGLFKSNPQIALIDIYRKVEKGEYQKENIELLFAELDLDSLSKMPGYTRRKLTFGLKLNQVFNQDNWSPENFNQFLGDPMAFISSHLPDFPKYKLELVKMIIIEQRIKSAETAYAIKFGQDPETAMAPDDVRSANIVFNEKLEPYIQEKYQSQFSAWGSTDDCLIHIEQMIRDMLLDKLKEEAELEGNTHIINFIEVNRETLKKGMDQSLMDEARQLFQSPKNVTQIAWRAYDRFAPVKGGWPNLLTPSHQSEAIFAGVAADTSTIPMESATKEARRRSAYYFLAAIDDGTTLSFENDADKKEFDNTKDSRLFNYIDKIAEIRRAHNDNLYDKDDPSCYPGTIGRIGLMGLGHPIAKTIETRSQIIQSVLQAQLFSFIHEAVGDKSAKELKGLQKSLLLRGDPRTASDLLDGKVPYSQDLLALRDALIQSFRGKLEAAGGIDTLINNELRKQGKDKIKPDEKLYIDQFFTDITRTVNSQSGTEIINKAIEQRIKQLAIQKESKKEQTHRTTPLMNQFDLNTFQQPQIQTQTQERQIKINELKNTYGENNPFVNNLFKSINLPDLVWKQRCVTAEKRANTYNIYSPLIHQILAADLKEKSINQFTESLVNFVESNKQDSMLNVDRLTEFLSDFQLDYPKIDLSAIKVHEERICTTLNTKILEAESTGKFKHR